MRKLILYSATSLNHKIAAADGGVAWLDSIPNPGQSDYGYYAFYDRIDTTIMGNATYQQVISWDIPFPYPDRTNFVLTRDSAHQDTEHVQFVSGDVVDFVKILKQQPGKDIWLIGGGQINTLLFNAGLIDEMIIHVMPILLSGGIDLFEGLPAQQQLRLVAQKAYESGVLELHYQTISDD
ncbi:MAG: dihydrofolate reductase family protein [Bacteroidota bacterium]